MTRSIVRGACAGILAILAAGGSVAHSQHLGGEASAEKAVDYRASYMTILKWNAGPMGKMLKGEAPFDDEAFLAYARDLSRATELDLLAGFPEGSAIEGSDALEEIWFNWEDFEKKFSDLRTAGQALGTAAGAGDVEATKAAFADVGEACKACHKAYKE